MKQAFSGGVKLSLARKILWAALAAAAVFAAWVGFRPYEWRPDPVARCVVERSRVTRDHSYYWLEVHLKVNEGEEHDLQQPVSLLTAGGDLDPADTTFASEDGRQTTAILLKFWLEDKQLQGPLDLRINGGKLGIKTGTGVPSLGGEGSRYFLTKNW